MNGIVLIDKPKGITSYDVVHKLKKYFNTNKIGHSGTLDPNATGLVIIAINKSTKALPFIYDDKQYRAKVELGYSTDSQDKDGSVIETETIKPFKKDDLIKAISQFTGKLTQTPPIYSAIKVAGKRLYEYARENKLVKIPNREIEINSIKLLEFNDNWFSYEAHVSSGTYIRTLSVDIAKKISNIGCTIELRRTKIGKTCVKDANKLDDKTIKIWPLNDFIKFPKIIYEDENKILNGNKIKLDTKHNQVLLIDKNKNPLAIYIKENDLFRCKRGLF